MRVLTKAFIILGLVFLQLPTSGVPAVLVAEGRAFLAAKNLAGADAKFAAALAEDPSHQHANFLRAFTRVLILAEAPAADALLDRFGFDAAGRDIYLWESFPAETPEGDLIAPPGVSAQEAFTYLRGTLLPELVAARGNLARVTDENFIITLSDAETTKGEVTVDFADVYMLRALVSAAELFIYTLNSWNFDLQLTAVADWLRGGSGHLEDFVAAHPQILSAARSEDIPAARAAFLAALNGYLDASSLIRVRNPDMDRLFTIDPIDLPDEAIFRTKIEDVRASLNGPVQLRANEDYTVHAAKFFETTWAPRGYLPKIYRDTWVAGSIPDLTFGNVVTGFERGQVEEGLAQIAIAAPKIGEVRLLPDNQVSITFDYSVYYGTPFAVDQSSDLIHWREIPTAFPFSQYVSSYDYRANEYVFSRTFVAPNAGGDARFYRVALEAETIYFMAQSTTGATISTATIVVNPNGSVYPVGYGVSIPKRFFQDFANSSITVSAPGFATRVIPIDVETLGYWLWIQLAPQ